MFCIECVEGRPPNIHGIQVGYLSNFSVESSIPCLTDFAEIEYGEIKIQSDLDGSFNFVLGMNTTDGVSHGGYYVNANSLDFISLYGLAPIGIPQLYPGFFHNDGWNYSNAPSNTWWFNS